MPCHKQELHILRHLRERAVPPSSLANLVWDSAAGIAVGNLYYNDSPSGNQHVQFGITPAGRRFTMSDFDSTTEFGTANYGVIE